MKNSAPLPLDRPLSPLEAFDLGVWLFRDRAGLWLALGTLPGVAFTAALLAFYDLAAYPSPDLAPDHLRLYLLVGAAILAVLWLARGLATFAVSDGLRRLAQNETPRVMTVAGAALKRLPAAFAIHGAQTACTLGGLLLFVYPGLFCMVRTCLWAPSSVWESLSPSAALRRSNALARLSMAGAVLQLLLWLLFVFVLVDLLFILAYIPELARIFLGEDFGLGRAFPGPDDPHVRLAAAGLAVAVLDPLRACVQTVLYLNARTSHEGAFLLLRLQQLREARSRPEAARAD